MRRILAATTMAVMVAGCSGASPDKLATLRSGVTTVDEAIALLGTPERDETLSDGSRMLVYVEQSSHTKAVNFVPGASHVWGGWRVKSGEAGLMFSPDGKLRLHSWSADDHKQMRNVGQAVTSRAAGAPAEKQDPPPVSGQGAESSGQPDKAN